MRWKCNIVNSVRSSSSQTKPTSVIYLAKNTKMPKKHSMKKKTTRKLKDKQNKSIFRSKNRENNRWLSRNTESLNWGKNWQMWSTTPWTWSERNRPEGMRSWMMLKMKRCQKSRPKLQSTTLKTCLSAGTANPFLIGCISFTDSESSTNAKSAATTPIGADEPLRCISKSGDTLTAWGVLKSPTPSILKTSQRSAMQLRFTRNSPEKAKTLSSDQIWRKSSKTTMATFSTEKHIWTWKSKGFFDDVRCFIFIRVNCGFLKLLLKKKDRIINWIE